MERSKEITQFSGLNLRQAPDDVADTDLIQITNLDVSRKPGTLVIRKGKEFLYTVAAGKRIEQVAKVNGVRFQVADGKLFRDGVAIASDLKVGETNFQAFRPLNDIFIWAFIANDNYMLKANDFLLYLWGIDLIPTPAPQIANQTGARTSDTITAGTYFARVTQLRWV